MFYNVLYFKASTVSCIFFYNTGTLLSIECEEALNNENGHAVV